MTLHTVRVPQPAAGHDWKYQIPGIYLERITGITAQLTTFGGAVTVMRDSSGNGNDGQYVNLQGPSKPPIFVPGLVAGDNALQSADPGPSFRTSAFVSVDLVDCSADFTVAWWDIITADMAGANIAAWDFDVNATGQDVQAQYVPGPAGFFEIDAGFMHHWQTANGTAPADGLPHFHVVVFTHTGPTFTYYVDGAVVPWSTTGTAVNNTSADFFDIGANVIPQTIDEFVTIRSALSAGQVSALYTAGLAGFGSWVPAVLAFSPTGFYHLDDVAAGTGRTPGLEVTDGTHTVERIPDGFTAQSTGGPYLFSWLPGLSGSTRDPSGLTTTVDVPDLLLPGGYTVGTRTPDIQPTDQWSAVVVWWDDSVQQGTIGFDPYAFPGGILLRYQREEVPA